MRCVTSTERFRGPSAAIAASCHEGASIPATTDRQRRPPTESGKAFSPSSASARARTRFPGLLGLAGHLRKFGLAHRPPGQGPERRKARREVLPDQVAVRGRRESSMEPAQPLEAGLQLGFPLASPAVPRLEVVQHGPHPEERVDRRVVELHARRRGGASRLRGPGGRARRARSTGRGASPRCRRGARRRGTPRRRGPSAGRRAGRCWSRRTPRGSRPAPSRAPRARFQTSTNARAASAKICSRVHAFRSTTPFVSTFSRWPISHP